MYTHTGTYRHAYTQTHRHMYRHIHVHTRRHMYRYTHVHTHRHTPPHKKLLYFVVHSQSPVLHSRGEAESTAHKLCFHCSQLLSSLTAPSANDRSGLSSEPAQQDGPGGHTHPHHNFHSPLASR
ncbi:unnamed protein product [Staurois parvus]|uniref:Uncharacterized protein n=1 Tax=Staurois parvus TaxID=386267 RepID=A0ABN9FBI6_9NEOB|nr:unnamed protein product [Staurois parvus]